MKDVDKSRQDKASEAGAIGAFSPLGCMPGSRQAGHSSSVAEHHHFGLRRECGQDFCGNTRGFVALLFKGM